MVSESVVRTSLWMSVVYNIVASYLLAFPSSFAGQLVVLPQAVPVLYASIAAFAVFLCGLIYFWVALQTRLYQPFIFLGGFAKLCCFIIIVTAWCFGHTSGVFALLAIGDFIFALIWLQFSYSTKTNA